MADLHVTFGRIVGPVMRGRNVRTDSVAIGGSSTPSSLVCDPGDNNSENVADLVAGADCWVKIGPSPTATAGDGTSFPMLTGERVQKSI